MTNELEDVSARFDDERAGRHLALSLHNPHRVMVAYRLDQVRDVIRESESEAQRGAWVAGFVAYEAAPAFDDALAVRDAKPGLPLAWFAAFRDASDAAATPGGAYALGQWSSDVDEDKYAKSIALIHELITSGDTYQTNRTFLLRAPFEGDSTTFYRDLLDAQRGGYHSYLSTGDRTIVSASPELFFRWDGRRIETRPMKGTMPRGRWDQEDRQTRELLLTSEKNRAENVMIVDLLRSDVGRVARFGTVKVERLFDLERFETVWQMTSTIAAETRPDVGLVDILAAMFPCGSVTGAPKARTMEIITDMETSPRGVYCGAIGLLAPPGSGRPKAEFSVAIRTAEISDGICEYGVGGGIVHESTADDEYQEAMVKAKVLRRRRTDVTLLETMRWDPETGVWLLDRHLDRLRTSARYFDIDVPEAEIARLLSAVESDTPLWVRLLVPERGEPDLASRPLESSRAIIGLAVDDLPIDRWDVFRYHKTTDRSVYDAAAARHPGADDVVLVNDRREVVETTRSNIAVKIDDEWLTPPLAAGCLPGVYREELIDFRSLREHPLFLHDLLDAAEEIAVVNSVRGWVPAKLLHGA